MRFLTLIISIFLLANTAVAAPFQADAKTRRIPSGTKFKLQLLDPITTIATQEGDYFSAMLIDDQKLQSNVILPAGSIVRGSINKITKSKRFSRGAVIFLDFDHVVTPNGRQIPLDMSVCGRTDITYDGGIYGALGYGQAVQENWSKTVDITQKSTDFAMTHGEDFLKGYTRILTVPTCALGGALGGGAYLFGDSIMDLMRKGKDVNLNQGTELDVILTQPIDIPVY